MWLVKRSSDLLAVLGALALYVLSPVALGEEPLVVAHTGDYPPLNFMRDGKLVGIEVDNAREVGLALGREVKTVVLPFAELIPALNSGKVDVVMAGVSVTPEREGEVLFAEPFMEVGQMGIILADKAVDFANPRAVYREGIRVGVEPGTTGEKFLRERVGTARILHYEDSEAAFQALRDDKIDMYVHDAPTSWQLSIDRNNQDMLSLFRPLTKENLAWAVRKDNTPLAARLNAVMDELKRTGRLRAIQNYWIPVRVQLR
jgi:polar amino acid transport system substrate-binding protein